MADPVILPSVVDTVGSVTGPAALVWLLAKSYFDGKRELARNQAKRDEKLTDAEIELRRENARLKGELDRETKDVERQEADRRFFRDVLTEVRGMANGNFTRLVEGNAAMQQHLASMSAEVSNMRSELRTELRELTTIMREHLVRTHEEGTDDGQVSNTHRLTG